MAGYIGISDEEGLSLGSLSFTSIIEYTKKHFEPDDLKYTVEIYDIYDNWGQQAIELEEQNNEGYNAFFKATCLALQKYRQDTQKSSPLWSEFRDGTIQTWQELIDMLVDDRRYQNIDVQQ